MEQEEKQCVRQSVVVVTTLHSIEMRKEVAIDYFVHKI
jgi:hypothetical protein